VKFYTASKIIHAHLWQALRSSGIQVTATWIDEAGEGQTASYAELADRCIREVAQADAVLLYCAPGETLKGALIEVGAALALGKRVFCVGDCPSLSRVFKAHPLWSSHPSIESALAAARACP